MFLLLLKTVSKFFLFNDYHQTISQMQRKISQEGREGQTVRRQGECMFVRPSLSTQHQFLLCHLLAHSKRRAESDKGGHGGEGGGERARAEKR